MACALTLVMFHLMKGSGYTTTCCCKASVWKQKVRHPPWPSSSCCSKLGDNRLKRNTFVDPLSLSCLLAPYCQPYWQSSNWGTPIIRGIAWCLIGYLKLTCKLSLHCWMNGLILTVQLCEVKTSEIVFMPAMQISIILYIRSDVIVILIIESVVGFFVCLFLMLLLLFNAKERWRDFLKYLFFLILKYLFSAHGLASFWGVSWIHPEMELIPS